VVIISLTHKGVFLILPSRKRKFLSTGEVLENLKKGELDEVGMPEIAPGKDKKGQLSFFMDDEDHVLGKK